MRVAGVDGAPGGWAVVVSEAGRLTARKIATIGELFADGARFDIVAVDMPVGLAERYEPGGRACEREARRRLGRPRASSVFATPARPVLAARTYAQACKLSRDSAPGGKAISRQTFGILPKIDEIDAFLRERPDLAEVVHEVHPELIFRELTGAALADSKSTKQGRDIRRRALGMAFARLEDVLARGRPSGLPVEDILDAAAACWSAQRLAQGKGYSLVEPIPRDARGLPMTIWV